MKIGFKYKYCNGFGRLYNYGLKYYPNYMITKQAEQRKKILLFWKQYGLEATTAAYGAKRSTLYYWQKLYKDSGYRIKGLDPGKQTRKSNNKREIHSLILKEIRRLRLEVCPNIGKGKIKKYLDIFCSDNGLPVYSESKIGRIIKEKKIYHHRRKFYHDGSVKTVNKAKKLRKPDDFQVKEPGDLVEVDTIVKYIYSIKRYVITAVDIKTRYSFALAYKKHDSASARDFIQKLRVVFPYQIKAIQTDNGSEFHKYFRDYLKEQNITHYWNYPGRPCRQGHIEKYNRTIQEEFIDQNEILLENPNEFNKKLIGWLLWYNTDRYHWSLNLTSPVDYLLDNCLVSNMRWTNTILAKHLTSML
ncbi:MAG: DDE-type integrase/transposase/recombinase [Patescibacteria group bacterium]